MQARIGSGGVCGCVSVAQPRMPGSDLGLGTAWIGSGPMIHKSQGIYVKIATVVLIEFVSVAESGGERCGWSGTQREKGSDLPRRNSESNGVNTLRFQCDRDVQRLIPPYLN